MACTPNLMGQLELFLKQTEMASQSHGERSIRCLRCLACLPMQYKLVGPERAKYRTEGSKASLTAVGFAPAIFSYSAPHVPGASLELLQHVPLSKL